MYVISYDLYNQEEAIGWIAKVRVETELALEKWHYFNT